MCGRIHCTLTPLAILRMFAIHLFLKYRLYTPKYNLAPTNYLPAIRNSAYNTPTKSTPKCKISSTREFENNDKILHDTAQDILQDEESKCNDLVAESMKWGFHNTKGPLVINARIEDIKNRTMFKSLTMQRCIVPVNGYYEWKTQNQNISPYYINHMSSQTLLLGAIYKLENGISYLVIITTEANGNIAKIHDRRPVILDQDGYR